MLIALSIVAVPGMLFAAGWWRRLGIAGLCIAAVAVGYWFARRTAREISEPVQQLAAQAELVGDGSAVFRPLRTDIDAYQDRVNEQVTGKIGLKLYKGSVRVVTRESPNAVYDATLASFAESGGLFSQTASPGFIELWSLQSRMAHQLRERRS